MRPDGCAPTPRACVGLPRLHKTSDGVRGRRAVPLSSRRRRRLPSTACDAPPPPGWYSKSEYLEKYWDGKAWTGATRPRGKSSRQKTAPPKSAPAAVPVPDHSKIVCQFCQQVGHVTVRHFKKDRRLSVTRLASGVVTAGGSVLLHGVTNKDRVTRLTCSNCEMTWDS